MYDYKYRVEWTLLERSWFGLPASIKYVSKQKKRLIKIINKLPNKKTFCCSTNSIKAPKIKICCCRSTDKLI